LIRLYVAAFVSSEKTESNASIAPAVAPPVGAVRAVIVVGRDGERGLSFAKEAAVKDASSLVAAVPPVPTAEAYRVAGLIGTVNFIA